MKSFFAILYFVLAFVVMANAQPGSGNANGNNMPAIGVLSGKVIDQENNVPVEFASVILYSMRDSSMIGGTITDATGSFLLKDLPMGRFFLDIKFIGYEHLVKQDIKINPKTPTINLGEINLAIVSEEIGEVNIVAERTQVQYKLDKKVINVGQDVTAAGGTAVDVLEKSPAVQTDIDGNVTLRGSSSFTVFIDGKPSVLQGSDALQQIPASEIENIEIITNPSAKYDPDGVAGIINVVLKKNRASGISGIINASIGTNHKYKADALVNFRSKNLNWFVGANWRDYEFLGGGSSLRETYLTGQTNYLNSDGERNMFRGGNGFKSGFDLNITNNQTLSLSAEYGTFDFGRYANSNYTYYTSLDPNKSYYNSLSNFDRGGPHYSVNLNYQINFAKPGHNLQAQINYHNDISDETELTEQYDMDVYGARIPNSLYSLKTDENASENEWRAKIDYVIPFTETRKLEAGYQARLDNSYSEYLYQNYDADLNQWTTNETYSNDMEYKNNIHAVYATYSDQFAGFGIQFGLRGEYADRNFYQITTRESFPLEKFDIFPSLHINRKITESFEAQAGYSKRIDRPNGRFLNPYPNFADEFSVNQGNPMLEPAYTNSYELNFIKRFGNSSLSLETYYRQGSNLMTRIQTVLPDGRLLSTWDNLNKDHAIGSEIMANVVASKAINFMLSGNLYYYSFEGSISDQDVSNNSINFDARFNATLKLKSNTRFQVNGFYSGASVTAQGTREAFIFANIAARQSLFNDKLNLTLSLRDPFGTMKHKFTSLSETFFNETEFSREARVFEFSVSYKINNYNSKKQRENGGENQESDFGDEM